MDKEALIFNIQRFSIHDGPGIRTTVFMKGCNLSCFWCHNPESISPRQQLQFFPVKCIGCGCCAKVCPHSNESEGGINRSVCEVCGACAEACPPSARVLCAKLYTPDECCKVVMRDNDFYKNSGGGVTFSGGEPLLQADFISRCFEILKPTGMGFAIDTAGNVPWTAFEKVLNYNPLFLFDLKHPDEQAHRAATGVGTSLIHENLRRLSETGCEIYVRIPVIPGFNDSDDTFHAFVEIIKPLRIAATELMPFHRFGEGKYQSLGMDYGAEGLRSPDDARIAQLREILISHNINAVSG